MFYFILLSVTRVILLMKERKGKYKVFMMMNKEKQKQQTNRKEIKLQFQEKNLYKLIRQVGVLMAISKVDTS